LETITNIGLNKHIDSASGHLGSATYGAQDDSEHNDLNFTTTILTNGYPTDLTTYGQNIARTSQTLQNGQWHSSSATGTGGTTSPYFRINLENDCYVDNIILHRTDGTDGITDTYGSTRFTNVRFQLLDSNEVQVKEVNVGTFSLDSYKTGICQVSGIRYVKVVTDSSTGYTHYDEIRINGYIMNVTATTPSQTYDTTKTITVKNVPSTLTDVAGKIYKGSTAYPIHTTTSSSNVIIKNTGTYVSVFTTATQAFLTNAIGVTTQPTTTSDDTTIEDVAPSTSVDITLAFHYAGFVATDYNSAYATKEAAAANGFVYADTPDGTYSWGTLTVTSNTTSNTQYTWAISGTGIVDYLVVAGGGAGGNDRAGGGGAGGYRTSVSGDLSGGSTSSETPLSISSGTYSIIVGNGGQWGGETGDTSPGPNGNDSLFHTIT